MALRCENVTDDKWLFLCLIFWVDDFILVKTAYVKVRNLKGAVTENLSQNRRKNYLNF